MTNTVSDRLDNNKTKSSSTYRSNPQSNYFDGRPRGQQQQQQIMQDNTQEQLTEKKSLNPFLQDISPQTETLSKENELQPTNTGRSPLEQDNGKGFYSEYDTYPESRNHSKSNLDVNIYSREVYGELNGRPSNRSGGSTNERLLIERRTPDAYGRSPTMSSYNKGKVGDYEDVYASYATENEYGKTYAKPPNPSQSRDAISISSHLPQQDYAGNYVSTLVYNFKLNIT